MHGIIAIVMPAWSIPQSVPPRLVSARAEARISGSVKIDARLSSTSAPRNSFHDVTNANSVTVTIAGTTAGMKIERRICHELPPSVSAASSSSRGHRLEAVAHDVQAERQLDRRVEDGQSDQGVGQLSWANIRKIGVSSAWYGMISASSRKTKMRSLAGIGNRASA